MKLSYDDDKIIIYINKIDNIDFNNVDSIKEYFKNIFIQLKNNNNLKLNGIYTVNIYKDNVVIIELYNEEESYFDEIEMKIVLEDTIFLYQIEDIFIDMNILKKTKILKHNNNLYLYIKEKLTNIELGYLYEISKIIYKNTENIIKYSRELPLNLI